MLYFNVNDHGEICNCGNVKYPEILELYRWAKENNFNVKLEGPGLTGFKGFIIRFPSGFDFAQTAVTYSSSYGMIEPGVFPNNHSYAEAFECRPQSINSCKWLMLAMREADDPLIK